MMLWRISRSYIDTIARLTDVTSPGNCLYVLWSGLIVIFSLVFLAFCLWLLNQYYISIIGRPYQLGLYFVPKH
jgi:hypothetical protein